MTFPPQTVQPTLESLIQAFFQRSEEDWRSQHRYYTLKNGETQEVVSLLTVQFLEQGKSGQSYRQTCLARQEHYIYGAPMERCDLIPTSPDKIALNSRLVA